MSFAFGTTITVLRDVAGSVDAYGDPSTASTTRIDIAGCGVAPRYSTEPNTLGRNGVIVGLTIFAPYGSDILFTDRIEIAGVSYLVEGSPENWKNPFTGSTPGMEIAVKRAVG